MGAVTISFSFEEKEGHRGRGRGRGVNVTSGGGLSDWPYGFQTKKEELSETEILGWIRVKTRAETYNIFGEFDSRGGGKGGWEGWWDRGLISTDCPRLRDNLHA